MGEELASHYASADLFLFASLSETWGNVLGEAMASGLGTVAYRRAAGAALIRHRENGLAPPSGDETAFVRAAVTLAEDVNLRRRLGAQASRDMATHHGWEAVTERLEGILLEVASQAIHLCQWEVQARR